MPAYIPQSHKIATNNYYPTRCTKIDKLRQMELIYVSFSFFFEELKQLNSVYKMEFFVRSFLHETFFLLCKKHVYLPLDFLFDNICCMSVLCFTPSASLSFHMIYFSCRFLIFQQLCHWQFLQDLCYNHKSLHVGFKLLPSYYFYVKMQYQTTEQCAEERVGVLMIGASIKSLKRKWKHRWIRETSRIWEWVPSGTPAWRPRCSAKVLLKLAPVITVLHGSHSCLFLSSRGLCWCNIVIKTKALTGKVHALCWGLVAAEARAY